MWMKYLAMLNENTIKTDTGHICISVDCRQEKVNFISYTLYYKLHIIYLYLYILYIYILLLNFYVDAISI